MGGGEVFPEVPALAVPTVPTKQPVPVAWSEALSGGGPGLGCPVAVATPISDDAPGRQEGAYAALPWDKAQADDTSDPPEMPQDADEAKVLRVMELGFDRGAVEAA